MIFLAGPHGAGKTQVTELLRPLGFFSLDLGPIIRGIHMETAPDITLREWVESGEQKYGADFTNAVIARFALTHLEQNYINKEYKGLIISGNRSVRGMLYLKQALRPLLPQELGWLVYLEAPFSLLHKRYCSREKVQLSKEEFQKVLDAEQEMGLGDLRGLANIHIKNDASLRRLEGRVMSFLHATYQIQNNLVQVVVE